MFDKLMELEVKFESIQADLSNPEVISDIKKLTTLSKELKDLQPVVEAYRQYKVINQELEEAKELIEIETDNEMKEMLRETIETCEEQISDFQEKLKVLLLPKDPNDGKNAIIEIRGAAGGDEANIFAADLYRMYSKYAETQHWKLEVMDSQETQNGGFSNISILAKGEDVFSKMKFESGAHRVQRVPVTESQGRIHTSTATVVVMPELDDVDVQIKDNDVRIDVFRSSGAGGQSVNTTDSAVRVTHIETGIVVSCQTERSQISNRERALKVLRSKLYEHYLQAQMSENDSMRKDKLGSGDRSEKIRTYNYPQNRVTDHRIGLSLNKLDQVMDGKLDEIIDALILEDQMEKMKASGND